MSCFLQWPRKATKVKTLIGFTVLSIGLISPLFPNPIDIEVGCSVMDRQDHFPIGYIQRSPAQENSIPQVRGTDCLDGAIILSPGARSSIGHIVALSKERRVCTEAATPSPVRCKAGCLRNTDNRVFGFTRRLLWLLLWGCVTICTVEAERSLCL